MFKLLVFICALSVVIVPFIVHLTYHPESIWYLKLYLPALMAILMIGIGDCINFDDRDKKARQK